MKPLAAPLGSPKWSQYGIWLGLLLLAAIGAMVTQGRFLGPDNLVNIAKQVSVNGILAVGMTLVILIGGIDLSIGSIVALAGISAALAAGVAGAPLGLLAGILTGLALGWINGGLITSLRLPPFVVTLGMMTAARGLALVLSGGQAQPVNDPFVHLGAGTLYGWGMGLAGLAWLAFLPVLATTAQRMLYAVGVLVALIVCHLAGGLPVPVLVFAGVALAAACLLNRMRTGRYLYALGGNPEAARLSGLPTRRLTVGVFAAMGALAGLAGVVLTARLGASTPTMGSMFELDAIAAAVIGGTSLSGGVGTIGGTVIGVFLIGVLNNLLSLLNVNPFYQLIIKGAIVVAAAALDARRRQGA